MERRWAAAFRFSRPTIIEHGLSVSLAGSIQLVSPSFLVPRVEPGLSTVLITTGLMGAGWATFPCDCDATGDSTPERAAGDSECE